MTAEQRVATVYAGTSVFNMVHEVVTGMRKAQSQRLRRSPLKYVPGAVGIVDLVDQSSTMVDESISRVVSVTAEVLSPIMRLMTPVDSAPIDGSRRGAAVLAAIGAAVGDSLANDRRTQSLVPELDLRADGKSITTEEFARRSRGSAQTVVVFLHGLGCTELNWSPEVIGGAGPATAALIRYPTGSSIADNGDEFAMLLDELLRAMPECQRLVLVGHSMGGLVARRAIEVNPYVADRVTDLITLGSPHGGSPIEKGAQAALLTLGSFAATKPLARLGHRRSAGIKDLRHGAIRAEDWGGHDPDTTWRDRTRAIPLPDHVNHYAVAASWPEDSSGWKSGLIGDGAVRQASAKDDDVEAVAGGSNRYVTVLESSSHLSLMSHPEVAKLIAGVVSSQSEEL